MGPWRDRALCKGQCTLFFSEESRDIERAVAICAGCEVRALCAQEAVHIRATCGVWGGTTPLERGWIGGRRTPRRAAERLALRARRISSASEGS